MEPFTIEERALLEKILARLLVIKAGGFVGTPWDQTAAGPLLDRFAAAIEVLLAMS